MVWLPDLEFVKWNRSFRTDLLLTFEDLEGLDLEYILPDSLDEPRLGMCANKLLDSLDELRLEMYASYQVL
ncbi:hypothetical protein RCL_jg14795.t1 [Rhizophagus clarus]|uniref:Uncharacterized protein n=1 Tax=Rhizophagus clarus TaxID=94130 RepID=A0A8H3QYK8_9GLOM|nr:hypothetical protein RCL_jg14795.t1 [Rhizophagus clarus]